MIATVMMLLISLPSMAATVNEGKIIITVGNEKSQFQRSGIKLAVYQIATGEYGNWTAAKELPGLWFTQKESDNKWVDETVQLINERLKYEAEQESI